MCRVICLVFVEITLKHNPVLSSRHPGKNFVLCAVCFKHEKHARTTLSTRHGSRLGQTSLAQRATAKHCYNFLFTNEKIGRKLIRSTKADVGALVNWRFVKPRLYLINLFYLSSSKSLIRELSIKELLKAIWVKRDSSVELSHSADHALHRDRFRRKRVSFTFWVLYFVD